MMIMGKHVTFKFQINVLQMELMDSFQMENNLAHHVLKEHGNMKIEIMKGVPSQAMLKEDRGVQLK